MDFFVHSSSFVDSPCEIGAGTKIWHFCHVMPHAKIGGGCVLGQNVSIASYVVIGNNVHIQNNVSIYTGVELEDDVFCGPSCVFTNVINPALTNFTQGGISPHIGMPRGNHWRQCHYYLWSNHRMLRLHRRGRVSANRCSQLCAYVGCACHPKGVDELPWISVNQAGCNRCLHLP